MEPIATPLNESKVFDTAAKFFRLLEKEDVEWKHYRRPIDSRRARRYLAEFLRLGCPAIDSNCVVEELPTSLEFARTILENNLITPDEIGDACEALAYTDEQVAALNESLPSRETLNYCRQHDYLVLPTPPKVMTVMAMWEVYREFFGGKEFPSFYNSLVANYEQLKPSGWLAIAKKGIWVRGPRDFAKTQAGLNHRHRTVPASELVWTLATLAKVSGERLLNYWQYALTSSADFERIGIAFPDGGGLDVYSDWDQISPSPSFVVAVALVL